MKQRHLSKSTRLALLSLLTSLVAVICASSVVFAQSEANRKVLFISGWALWPPNLEETVDPRPGWDDIKSFLMTNPMARRLNLSEEDFLYFSYSGEYERKPDGSKDYTRPKYQRKHTSLNFADYQARAAIVTKIINAYPDATFDLIGHSLGGVVDTYWAATQMLSPVPGGNPVLERVHSVITIDSPLQGKAGLCREQIDIPFRTEIPPEIVSVLPDARARVRLFTVRNTEDKVVPPESATLQDVWRDLLGNFGGAEVNPCGSEAHGSVLHNQIVMTYIASAMVAGTVWTPTSDNPRLAGPHTDPRSIIIGFNYPQDMDARITFPKDPGSSLQVKRTPELTKDDFQVTVGGLAAEVLELEDVPLIAGYRLRVQPPPQAKPGLYSLTVAVGRESDTQTDVVRYTRPVPPSASTSTMLVLDVSGSMDWAEPSGGRKIDAAKKAADLIVEMIGAENETQGTAHELSIVAFSDSGELLQERTDDPEVAKDAIAGLEPLNGTNMAQGLAVANREMESVSPNRKRIIILLSDGVPTISMSGEQRDIPDLQGEVLSGPVAQAARAGYCLYVIGFGDPTAAGPQGEPSMDEDFLRSIAESTKRANNCGEYYGAQDARQLADVYIELRHKSTGEIIKKFSGVVEQGETTPPEQVAVPGGQEELHATLSWPGSQLDLILIDPKGRQVDENYPGATITALSSLVYTIINDPVAGNWQASVFGRDVPEGTADFSAIFSTRSRPPISWFEVMPFLIMLVTGLGMWFFVWLNQQSPGVVAPSRAGLRIASGPQAGRAVPFRRDVMTIGRGPNNDVALPDTRASRNHAQIRREPEGFVLYDQGSMNGTFVNGQQVSRHVLRTGDRIRIGETQLVFEGPAGGRGRGGRAGVS